jgi:hypothetical protein
MKFIDLDRRYRFRFFSKTYIFPVLLSNCIDEWGNSFGKNGNHPMVCALNASSERSERMQYLKEWYTRPENQIRSYNDISGRSIDDEIGKMYFCPWEHDRARPLEKFLKSHKVGPTKNEKLISIVKRLESTLSSILKVGYDYRYNLDNVIQVIKLIGNDQHEKYIIRDGQHRASVLSHLDYKEIPVCYVSDYHEPSKLFRFAHLLFRKRPFINKNNESIVNVENVKLWPHVVTGNTTAREALNHFNSVFNKSTIN